MRAREIAGRLVPPRWSAWLLVGVVAVLPMAGAPGVGEQTASAAPAAAPAATPSTVVPGSAAYRRVQEAWDAADGAEQRPAGTDWRSVRVGGVLRHYLISVPDPRAPAALVIAFHGLDQRAGYFGRLTGLVPATSAAGQVLVLPESSGPAFNDGRLGAAGPDDDAFTLAVVRQLVAARLVDPRRVLVAGFSNGAGMAMEVAAEHPHDIAAVVSIDGSLIDGPLIDGRAAPRPTGEVRAYLVHGTADRVQPWNGRPAAGATRPAYVSEPATVAAWVRADRTGAERTSLLGGGPGRAAVTVHTWPAGPHGADVTFYAITGMGHVWPTVVPDTVGATALVVAAATTAQLPRPVNDPLLRPREPAAAPAAGDRSAG